MLELETTILVFVKLLKEEVGGTNRNVRDLSDKEDVKMKK